MNLNEIKEAIQNFKDGKTANFSNKQFIQWLASLIEHYEELSADAIVLHKQVEEMQKTLEKIGSGINGIGLSAQECQYVALQTLQSLKGATQ